mmetsp:Transcript_2329/g.5521  ORF Transcript_2329/g.5521 Transcript_2329/m.5521 type:complete len:266 (+) Transcript_2329:836-1633(+)
MIHGRGNAPRSADVEHQATSSLHPLLLVVPIKLVVIGDSHSLASPAKDCPRVTHVCHHQSERSTQFWIPVQEGHDRCRPLCFKFLSLRQAQNFLVGLSEGFANRHFQLLIPRRWLYLLLSEVGQNILVKLLRRDLGNRCSAMAIEDSKIDAQLVHGLVQRKPVTEFNLLSRPALGMCSNTDGVCRDIVTFPLLLQCLCAGVDWERFAILAKHDDVQRPGLAILLAELVQHLGPVSEVDGIRVRGANDVPQVHEDTFGRFLTLLDK